MANFIRSRVRSFAAFLAIIVLGPMVVANDAESQFKGFLTPATTPVIAVSQPSFKCSGRLNPTEARICFNPQLAALDVQMAVLYKQRRAGLSQSRRNALKTQQQNWLRGRNACGANDSCIANAYNARIFALGGAISNPLPPPSPTVADVTVRYACDGGFFLTVRYNNATDGSATLFNPQGQSLRLAPVVSGSGARYQSSGVEWLTKGREGVIIQNGQQANCREQ